MLAGWMLAWPWRWSRSRMATPATHSWGQGCAGLPSGQATCMRLAVRSSANAEDLLAATRRAAWARDSPAPACLEEVARLVLAQEEAVRPGAGRPGGHLPGQDAARGALHHLRGSAGGAAGSVFLGCTASRVRGCEVEGCARPAGAEWEQWGLRRFRTSARQAGAQPASAAVNEGRSPGRGTWASGWPRTPGPGWGGPPPGRPGSAAGANSAAGNNSEECGGYWLRLIASGARGWLLQAPGAMAWRWSGVGSAAINILAAAVLLAGRGGGPRARDA